MKKLIIGTTLALLSVIAVENRAQASGGTGYICVVTFTPLASPSYGSYGYVNATEYSGPGCTGTFLGWNTFCTLGGSTSSCNWFYSELGLQTLFTNLREAAWLNEKVYIGWGTNNINNYPNFFAAGY